MINFFKIQASGNDFIVLLRADFNSAKLGDLDLYIKKICARKTGVGADGFIILDVISQKEMRWDFFNSDASSAEMCGNAARAVMKLFVEELNGQQKATLHSLGGLVDLEYLGPDKIKVKMPQNELLGEESGGRIWNTGVPHFVFEYDFSKLAEARQKAKALRFPISLNEKGANVSFWYKEKDKYLSISFERGVEDFTLACGTGACATGLDILKNLPQQNSVDLHLPGGLVGIERVKDSVYLIGSAEIVYSAKMRIS